MCKPIIRCSCARGSSNQAAGQRTVSQHMHACGESVHQRQPAADPGVEFGLLLAMEVEDGVIKEMSLSNGKMRQDRRLLSRCMRNIFLQRQSARCDRGVSYPVLDLGSLSGRIKLNVSVARYGSPSLSLFVQHSSQRTGSNPTSHRACHSTTGQIAEARWTRRAR